jgi:hypothetical protein
MAGTSSAGRDSKQADGTAESDSLCVHMPSDESELEDFAGATCYNTEVFDGCSTQYGRRSRSWAERYWRHTALKWLT